MILSNLRQAGLRRLVAALLVALLMLAGASSIYAVGPSDTITTVAGTGTPGYSGDGGLATAAQLNAPVRVALDAAGNIYIADQLGATIRKVTTAGTITTVAGTGTPGYSGDNSMATAAQLNNPTDVTVDATGNLYIADSINNRVRKVDTAGTITTVAGDGTLGYGGDTGPATSAQLYFPEGVALDVAGNLYIADAGGNRIRRVDTAGTITTVAGDGISGDSGDGGLATAAQLNNPTGVVLDTAGNLYIADALNNRVRKVSTAGTITTVAGTGTPGYSGDAGMATAAELNTPTDVKVDAAGHLYIADSINNRIRRVDTDGTITTVAGDGTPAYGGDGGPAGAAQLYNPTGMALDATGRLYIGDAFNSRVRRMAPGVAAFPFTGFFQPVDNAPTLNQVKAGQSLPIRFSLGGNRGLNILTTGYPASRQVTCDSTMTVDAVEETSTANSGLTYDAATNQYTYVWRTQKSWAGTCRLFTLRLTDGTDHVALFKFK